MQNGTQVLPDPNTVVGRSLTELDSRYLARWKGSWVAVQPTLALGPVDLAGTVELHPWTSYHADGNWNLREELVHPLSFEQDAKGWGAQAAVSGSVELVAGVAITVRVEVARQIATGGAAMVYFADGRTVRMTLRNSQWTTRAIRVGFQRAL